MIKTALPGERSRIGAATRSASQGRQLDPEALGDHIDRLYRAARSMCDSSQDAEDLVQETFARVLKKPRKLRSGNDLPYLLTVLRNTPPGPPATAFQGKRSGETAAGRPTRERPFI